eukprot:scaffold59720_cov19-Tisochrysis_lutea.AAC.2
MPAVQRSAPGRGCAPSPHPSGSCSGPAALQQQSPFAVQLPARSFAARQQGLPEAQPPQKLGSDG